MEANTNQKERILQRQAKKKEYNKKQIRKYREDKKNELTHYKQLVKELKIELAYYKNQSIE